MSISDSQLGHVCDFLYALFGYVEEGYIGIFQLGEDKRKQRHFPVDAQEAVAIYATSQENWNVYFNPVVLRQIPKKGRGSVNDTGALTCFWIDIDVETGTHNQGTALFPTTEEAVRFAKGLPTPPTFIVDTGGGIHCYWAFTEPWELLDERERLDAQRHSQNFQRAIRSLAAEMGYWVDNTSDLARVLRMPGTVNQKYGTYVHISHVRMERYNLSDFAWINDVKTSSVTHVVDTPSKFSGRNDRLKAIVNAMFYRGESIDRIVEEILRVDSQHDVPLFLDSADSAFATSNARINALNFVTSNVISAAKFLDSKGEAIPYQEAVVKRLEGIGVRLFNDLYLDDTEPPPDLIGPGLLGEGEMCLIAGPPKSMKSMLATELATYAALGLPYLGFDIQRPLKVAYLNCELVLQKFKTRIQGMPYTKQELELLGKNFAITDRFRGALTQQTRDMLVDGFLEAIGTPDVLIFDPLQNVYDGDENDNRAMNKWLDDIWAWRDMINPRAGIVLVHHTGKVDQGSMKENPFNAIRGASALRGRYDSCIFIHKTSEQSERRRIVFDLRYAANREEEFGTWGPNTGFVFETSDSIKERLKPMVLDWVRDHQIQGVFYSANGIVNKSGLDPEITKMLIYQMLRSGELGYWKGNDDHKPHPRSKGFVVTKEFIEC